MEIVRMGVGPNIGDPVDRENDLVLEDSYPRHKIKEDRSRIVHHLGLFTNNF